jgi:hypothetical protein
MSGVERNLHSSPELGLFNQIAMFCVAGFGISLMAALVYGFRISDWF